MEPVRLNPSLQNLSGFIGLWDADLIFPADPLASSTAQLCSSGLMRAHSWSCGPKLKAMALRSPWL